MLGWLCCRPNWTLIAIQKTERTTKIEFLRSQSPRALRFRRVKNYLFQSWQAGPNLSPRGHTRVRFQNECPPAERIVYAPTNRPSIIPIKTFAGKQTEVPKGLWVVFWGDLPDFIGHLDQGAVKPCEQKRETENMSVIDTAAAVQYKGKDLRDEQMNRHEKVQNKSDNELDTDWWENIFNDASTPMTPESIWTRWSNFNKCGMDFRVKFTRPTMHRTDLTGPTCPQLCGTALD